MSAIRREVCEWLEHEAAAQQKVAVQKCQEALDALRALSPREFLRRHGITNICPDAVPASVREWLELDCHGEPAHFQVRADPGNHGVRLEVYAAHREWDHIPDPWDCKDEVEGAEH